MSFINPLKGRISSPFGIRKHPVTGVAGKMHNGVDIPAPIGRHIVSPADGKVAAIFTHEFGGITLFINHANGFQSRYAHLNKTLVKEGAEVKQGQVVAENGNTGRSTGPHLHFGLVLNGRHVNPEDYINFG
jgi:murein DD-endopeptidase